MKRTWLAVNVVMLLMFLFSVVVQYNDPDPWKWMPMYGAAAVVCVLELRGGLKWWVPTLIAVACIAWAATIAPHVFGKVPFASMFSAWEMRNEGIEESRELYGLLIVTAWMAVLAVANRPRKPDT